MNQQYKHHFGGLYFGNFWSELKKLGQGGPLDLRYFNDGQKNWFILHVQAI